MESPSLHLVVQLYGQSHADLFGRMIDCISGNAALGFIEKISVLSQGVYHQFENKKIDVIRSRGRATFAECLLIAQDGIGACTHFAIANTDIFLSEDVFRVLAGISRSSSVAAVSRTELNGECHFDPKLSQDLWIFKAHKPSNSVLGECNYQLGVAGCEHRFAVALYSHGYDLWNPCEDCRIIHNDPLPKTDWADRYYGSYLYLPPCSIADIESEMPGYELSFARKSFGVGGDSVETVRQLLDRSLPLKLHLCSGGERLPGFISVDIRAEVNPDFVASADKLDMFEDETVDEVYFCHGLEHLLFRDTEKCLLEIRRVMKPGGLLRLALPDFEALSRLYVAGFVSLEELNPAIHGNQDYPENIHFASWDFVTLFSALSACGYTEIKRYSADEFLPKDFFDWSRHCVMGIDTSLNVQCLRGALCVDSVDSEC
jgi:predicted SAM-dependent methyltransferase